MYKDIRLFIENIPVKYDADKDKIIIKNVDDLEKGKVLKLFYDENVYDIKFDEGIKYENGKKGEIFISLTGAKLTIFLVLKKNYFVKSVYKYINKFIDKDTLMKEISLFIGSEVGKKYKDDLTSLLDKLENKDKSVEELIINNEDEYQRFFNLLINNETFLDIDSHMSSLELMLLITYYIYAPCTPKIDQDYFDDLVKAAENYDHALENIWRLGMNFDDLNYDFSLLEDFFIKTKDIHYLGEYIGGIRQADEESVINKIIATKDKDFIKNILNDDYLCDILHDDYKNRLKEYLNN